MRFIDIIDVAINMSGLMIKIMMMMMMNDSSFKFIFLLYNTVKNGDLTKKNIGRKQGFQLKESGQGNR
jgi:hypothetical protein